MCGWREIPALAPPHPLPAWEDSRLPQLDREHGVGRVRGQSDAGQVRVPAVMNDSPLGVDFPRSPAPGDLGTPKHGRCTKR